MKDRLQSIFVYAFVKSAGCLFAVTAAAKFFSSFGTSGILNAKDPIFDIHFRYVFWIAGTCEFSVALVCLATRNTKLQACLLAWLAASIEAYRFGYLWQGNTYCSCLGNLTDLLHVSPSVVSSIMQLILIYVILGSALTLLWHWRVYGKSV